MSSSDQASQLSPSVKSGVENIPVASNSILEDSLLVDNNYTNKSSLTPKSVQINTNKITKTPIVVSPLSNASSTQYVQSLAPLDPDNQSTSPKNVPDTYTLSNYFKPSDTSTTSQLKITPIPETDQIGNDILKDLELENNFYSKDLDAADDKDVENQILELVSSNNNVKENENEKEMNRNSNTEKSLETFRKPKPKKAANPQPQKRPAFVVKLWRMINDPSNSHFMSWINDGKAFQVNDRENFMKFVLPKYFKHNNFASFVRQLNMYGWHKMQDATSGSLANTEELWQFENPNFIKDREDLLDNIVRNKPTKETEDDEIDIKYMMTQLEQMKRNQLLISEDLRRVRQDNEMLWKENFVARERHKIQSETLEKIMGFLASIYGNNTSKLLEQMSNSNGVDPNGIKGPYPPVAPRNGYYYPNQNNINNDLTLQTQRYTNPNLDSNYPNHVHKKNYAHRPHPRPISPHQQQQQQQIHNQPNSIDDHDHFPFNQQNRYYNPRQTNMNYQSQKNLRRQLMLTNRSNDAMTDGSSNSRLSSDNGKLNELRMNNLGYKPSALDNTDSTIQEIHRGPENRNFDSYAQHVPDYVDTPRQFFQSNNSPLPQQRIAVTSNPNLFNSRTSISSSSSGQDILNNGNNDSNGSDVASIHQPINNPLNQVSPLIHVASSSNLQQHQQPAPLTVQSQQMRPRGSMGSICSHVMTHSIPSTISQPIPTNLEAQSPYQQPARTFSSNNKTLNTGFKIQENSAQIMGNIQQHIHKNQGTLKQVNDWITKYSDNLETDPLNDNFEVDDFLQQPLDLNMTTTPIDFNNVENFISADTPIQTPTISTPQLSLPIPSVTPLIAASVQSPVIAPTPIESTNISIPSQIANRKRISTSGEIDDSSINNITNPNKRLKEN